MKERLLTDEKLTLEKGICMARASEASKEQMKAMAPKEHSNENPSLNKIRHGGKQKKNSPRRPGSRGSGPTSQQGNCKFCGSSHSWGFCPTFGKTCGYCQRKDHFARVCRKKLQDLGGKTVSAMAEETDESDAGADLLTFSFKSSSESPLQDDWHVMLKIAGTNVNFKLDPGADCDFHVVVRSTSCGSEIGSSVQSKAV